MPRRLGRAVIAATIAVAAVLVLVFLVLPMFHRPLQTTILAIFPDGSQKAIYTDQPWPWGGAILQYNGQPINGLMWQTVFTAQVQGYSSYQVLGLPSGDTADCLVSPPIGTKITCPSYFTVDFGYAGMNPAVTVACTSGLASASFRYFPVPASFTNTLNPGTTYNLGNLAFGATNGTELILMSPWLLKLVSANGCPVPDAYSLSFWIRLTVQPVGTGNLPQATYTEILNTPLTVANGSISITGSTSFSTFALPLFLLAREAT